MWPKPICTLLDEWGITFASRNFVYWSIHIDRSSTLTSAYLIYTQRAVSFRIFLMLICMSICLIIPLRPWYIIRFPSQKSLYPPKVTSKLGKRKSNFSKDLYLDQVWTLVYIVSPYDIYSCLVSHEYFISLISVLNDRPTQSNLVVQWKLFFWSGWFLLCGWPFTVNSKLILNRLCGANCETDLEDLVLVCYGIIRMIN